MKRSAFVCLLLCFFVCGCNGSISNNSSINTEEDTQSISIESEEPATSEDENQERATPQLLRSETIPNRIFYSYSIGNHIYDQDVDYYIEWDWILGAGDTEHNEWIDAQTFNSLFTNADWCIRTGYYNTSGQWGVTFFYHLSLSSLAISLHGQDPFTLNNIRYPDGDYWLVSPDAFGVPNDHSVEITSFDETKKTVTLTFTSPEGETTEVYINYEKQCRCDENGTPLLNENGNTFLYQFEGDFIGTQYHELN